MNPKIDENSTEDSLDSFLKVNYGYGIWEFASSLQLIYYLYDEKKRHVVYKYIDDKVTCLKKIKTNLMENIDDFLGGTKFYELSKKSESPKKTQWPTPKRKDFIRKHYKLNNLYAVIDEQIKKYERLKQLFEPFLNNNMNLINEFPRVPLLPRKIKPIQLLALVWSFIMKRGAEKKQKDWINMVRLLNWFVKRLNNKGVKDIFHLEEYDTPPPELLRKYWNRYKESKYFFVVIIIFDVCFRQQKGKIPKPPHAINILKQRLKGGAEELKEIVDFSVLEELIVKA